MKSSELAKFRELMKAPSSAAQLRARIDLTAENTRLVDKNSPFFGMFKADGWSAFVEFDICHSLPVVAGPAYGTGNYSCWHPAALSKSHRTLLFKQTNLHHHIKSYDPENIPQDCIIGAIVMTQFPNEPEGGWQIPGSKAQAIPIHCCATVFKQAEGALEMLRDHTTGRQKWSVSVEMSGRSFEEMGVYFTQQNKIVPFLDLPDDVLMDAVSKSDSGTICLGKFAGEQLALCYGGVDGAFNTQGVGFTPTPAEKEAKLTKVSLSERNPSEVRRQEAAVRQPEDYEIEEMGSGVFAMVAASANTALATAAVAANFKGANLLKVFSEGDARLPGQFWKLAATPENPVVHVRLANGAQVLRYLGELTK